MNNLFSWCNLYTLLILCMAISSCNNLPKLSIDTKSWKEDRDGCLGNRKVMFDTIDAEKEMLLGLDEMEIVQLLGKPDQQELYKRNQKFFYYFFDASANCATPANSPRTLEIRFNAMSRAKEVAIQ